MPPTPTHPRTWPFFVMALGITWTLQLPAVLAQRGVIPGGAQLFLFPAFIGTFGPLIAALVAARLEGGGSVFASLRQRVPVAWLLVAVGACGAIHVAGWAVYRAAGGHGAGAWLYLPDNATQIAAMLVVPVAEEPGWRGFALPRLQARSGALTASLLLGVAWAAWHTMMFLFAGLEPKMFLVSLANILVGSVLFSWLYNRTGGSLLIALLAHAGAHLDNPSHALPTNPAPMMVYTLAIAVTAVVLVVADRRAWRPGRLALPRAGRP